MDDFWSQEKIEAAAMSVRVALLLDGQHTTLVVGRAWLLEARHMLSSCVLDDEAREPDLVHSRLGGWLRTVWTGDGAVVGAADEPAVAWLPAGATGVQLTSAAAVALIQSVAARPAALRRVCCFLFTMDGVQPVELFAELMQSAPQAGLLFALHLAEQRDQPDSHPATDATRFLGEDLPFFPSPRLTLASQTHWANFWAISTTPSLIFFNSAKG